MNVDNFFLQCLVFTNAVFETPTRIRVTQRRIRLTGRIQKFANYSVLKNVRQGSHCITGWWAVAPSCWKDPHSFSSSQNLWKNFSSVFF